jgi:uncharacterized protein YndB with AHSA1/START domain
MSTSTVRLHCVLRAPPERVCRQFLNLDAWANWLPAFGFVGMVHQMDPRAGGCYAMSFTHFATGHSHSSGGEYLELFPDQKLRCTAVFDDPHLPGLMQTTVTPCADSCGVELTTAQEGLPEMIPTEAGYLGWHESLQLLEQLMESDVRG